jgi:hypothetical protein
MNEDLENYVLPTIKEIREGKLSDPRYLQSITEKEYEVIALLERQKDIIWLDGETDRDTDGESIEDGMNRWKMYFATVEKEWANGVHGGDCTKAPATCFRCMCEEHLQRARRFIKWFNGPYNENTY